MKNGPAMFLPCALRHSTPSGVPQPGSSRQNSVHGRWRAFPCYFYLRRRTALCTLIRLAKFGCVRMRTADVICLGFAALRQSQQDVTQRASQEQPNSHVAGLKRVYISQLGICGRKASLHSALPAVLHSAACTALRKTSRSRRWRRRRVHNRRC